jgi:AraC-like DNA-binding protein
MDELAGVLGRERLLIEKLLFKLVELHQLLTIGEARFLPWAAEEVDRATARLRESELHRALIVNKIAARVGVADTQLSLRALANTTPEPFGSIFADHRRAFRELTSEVTEVLERCRALAEDGAVFVAEVLERVSVEREPNLARTTQPNEPIVLGLA